MEDDQRMVKAEIRSLDAAIDTAFLGADAGSSSRGSANIGRGRGGGGRGGSKRSVVDDSYDIQHQTTSQNTFSSTPTFYEPMHSYPPGANPQYGDPFEVEEPVTLARRLFFYGFSAFSFYNCIYLCDAG